MGPTRPLHRFASSPSIWASRARPTPSPSRHRQRKRNSSRASERYPSRLAPARRNITFAAAIPPAPAIAAAPGRLIAITENYPDLKSNQNFLALQSQLEGTENRIAVARGDYIEAVRQ